MNKNWPTKHKDMSTAQRIMEEFAHEQNSETLGLFELVVDKQEKRMNFRLASWVMTLARHFQSLYGASQGDFITRQVLSLCITKNQTIH